MSIILVNNKEKLSDIIGKVKNFISDVEYHKNYPDERYFQAILDVINDGYFDLDKEYHEQCEELKEISPVLAFINMYAGYSYQVQNGGHYQYFDNGYASGKRGAFRADNRDIDFHKKEFVPLFKQLKLQLTEAGFEVYDIINSFDIEYSDEDQYDYFTCDVCNGDGVVFEDEDEENEVECDNCYGSGEIEDLIEEEGVQNNYQLNSLDDRFYKINTQFEKELDTVLKTWIESEGHEWSKYSDIK